MKAEDKHALKLGIIFFAVFSLAFSGVSVVNATNKTTHISRTARNIFGVTIWTHSLYVHWQLSSGEITSHYGVHNAAGHAGLYVKSKSMTVLYENPTNYVHYSATATFGTWYMNSATSTFEIIIYADGTSWTWSNL